MTTALVVPDPRQQPVPKGWAADVAAPLIEAASWEELDEAEAQLMGMASYIASFEGDEVEFLKAMRIVEYRRGVLLGPDVTRGERTDLTSPCVGKFDIPSQTASRYRKIARHWDVVWPHVLSAGSRWQVTQARVLRLIDGDHPDPAPPSGEVPTNKSDLFVWELQNLYRQAPKRAQSKFRKWLESPA